MDRKDKIIRVLIATSGVTFGVSALMWEWKLTLIAVVPLLIAIVYGSVGAAPDTADERLRELLNKDQDTRP